MNDPTPDQVNVSPISRDAAIYLMCARKSGEFATLDLSGWTEFAWERCAYVECGIYTKPQGDLSTHDRQLIERYGKRPDGWIEPSPKLAAVPVAPIPNSNAGGRATPAMVLAARRVLDMDDALSSVARVRDAINAALDLQAPASPLAGGRARTRDIDPDSLREDDGVYDPPHAGGWATLERIRRFVVDTTADRARLQNANNLRDLACTFIEFFDELSLVQPSEGRATPWPALEALKQIAAIAEAHKVDTAASYGVGWALRCIRDLTKHAIEGAEGKPHSQADFDALDASLVQPSGGRATQAEEVGVALHNLNELAKTLPDGPFDIGDAIVRGAIDLIKRLAALSFAVPEPAKELCHCELSGFIEVVGGPWPGSCELCESSGREPLTAENVAKAFKWYQAALEKKSVPEPVGEYADLVKRLRDRSWTNEGAIIVEAADVIDAQASAITTLLGERDEAPRKLREMTGLRDLALELVRIKTKERDEAQTKLGVAMDMAVELRASRDEAIRERDAGREALRVAATAELYDPTTGIIDADVLAIVQETARAALPKNSNPTPEDGEKP